MKHYPKDSWAFIQDTQSSGGYCALNTGNESKHKEDFDYLCGIDAGCAVIMRNYAQLL